LSGLHKLVKLGVKYYRFFRFQSFQIVGFQIFMSLDYFKFQIGSDRVSNGLDRLGWILCCLGFRVSVFDTTRFFSLRSNFDRHNLADFIVKSGLKRVRGVQIYVISSSNSSAQIQLCRFHSEGGFGAWLARDLLWLIAIRAPILETSIQASCFIFLDM
jgi:hypothetical protein